MEKSQVVAGFLFPANKQPTRAVEPRMRAFNDPSSCPIPSNSGFLGLFLPTTANMLHIASCSHQQTHQRVIISCIQAEVLRMVLTWLGTSDDDPIQGGTKQLAVVAVGSIDDDRQGNACSISRACCVWSPFWRDRWDWDRSRLCRKELSSLPHRPLATPIGCLSLRRTLQAQLATARFHTPCFSHFWKRS